MSNGVPSIYAETNLTAQTAALTASALYTPPTAGFYRVSFAITLTTAGSWMLYARARVDYVAATFAAVRTVSLKLRRTNNTAGDVTAAASAFKTEIITTLTYTAPTLLIPVVQYDTALTTDILQMQVAIDTDPTAGSIQIVEADLVAVYLHA